MATNRPRDDHAEQQRADRGQALVAAARHQGDAEEDDDRRQHRQQRGDDHLADRGLGDEIDGARIIGANRAIHDARIVAELAAHFLDHRAAGAADRGHAHRPEQIGQQRAEQQADDDIGVGQAEQAC